MQQSATPLCSINHNIVVLVFTDGEPTASCDPPRGLKPSIINLLEKPNRRATLHTFGFGYKLDSVLLADVASAGQGVYAYLPDASMIGFTAACHIYLSLFKRFIYGIFYRNCVC